MTDMQTVLSVTTAVGLLAKTPQLRTSLCAVWCPPLQRESRSTSNTWLGGSICGLARWVRARQDDVCHNLGDEDDADEASETADEAEVGAEWDEPPAPVEPAASSAFAAVALVPSEFPPSRAGAMSKFLAVRIVYGKGLQIHTDRTM